MGGLGQGSAAFADARADLARLLRRAAIGLAVLLGLLGTLLGSGGRRARGANFLVGLALKGEAIEIALADLGDAAGADQVLRAAVQRRDLDRAFGYLDGAALGADGDGEGRALHNRREIRSLHAEVRRRLLTDFED